MVDFSTAIWVRLAHLSVREFSNTNAVWIEDVFLSICEFDGLDARLFDFLDRTIREDRLFFTIFKNALNRAVRESIIKVMLITVKGYLHDLLCLIREVLLDLVVAELEHLELIREGSLCRLGLSEVVDHFAVREGLLDILVVEVDDSVSIGERFALDSVIEDDFFFAILVDALDFPIVTDILLNDFLVRQSLAVILLGEFQTKVLFIVNCGPCCRVLHRSGSFLVIVMIDL